MCHALQNQLWWKILWNAPTKRRQSHLKKSIYKQRMRIQNSNHHPSMLYNNTYVHKSKDNYCSKNIHHNAKKIKPQPSKKYSKIYNLFMCPLIRMQLGSAHNWAQKIKTAMTSPLFIWVLTSMTKLNQKTNPVKRRVSQKTSLNDNKMLNLQCCISADVGKINGVSTACTICIIRQHASLLVVADKIKDIAVLING